MVYVRHLGRDVEVPVDGREHVVRQLAVPARVSTAGIGGADDAAALHAAAGEGRS
jgi:hypothetical protein